PAPASTPFPYTTLFRSERAAVSLRNAIQNSGRARIIAATGASQFEFLDALTAIEWPRVEMFHLDEYIGLPVSHPASFRKYLLERDRKSTRLNSSHGSIS